MWAAVVLQAREDLEFEERGGVIYSHAVAFFLHDGLWAQSRQSIADHLGLHPDDITRLGKATIAARNALEGELPVLPPREPKPAPAPYTPPVRRPGPERVTKPPREPHDREWWINQFMSKHAAA